MIIRPYQQGMSSKSHGQVAENASLYRHHPPLESARPFLSQVDEIIMTYRDGIPLTRHGPPAATETHVRPPVRRA